MTAILAALFVLAASPAPSPSPSPAFFSRCEAEARARFGSPPVQVGDKVQEPKRTKYVQPVYPKLTAGTRVEGIPIHEVLIGPDGAVHGVWAVRPLRAVPPFPAFEAAIVTAFRQWRYEPVLVQNRAVPFCVVMTTHIHFR